MTLREPVEAEHEIKREKVVVRLGEKAHLVLRATARRLGISVSRYMRETALERAIAYLGEGQDRFIAEVRAELVQRQTVGADAVDPTSGVG